MHFASWITKATDIHSKYVILSSLHRNGGYICLFDPTFWELITFVTLYSNGHPWMHGGAHSGIVTSTVAT